MMLPSWQWNKLYLSNTMAATSYRYDPKNLATGVVPEYVVKNSGDPYFVEAYTGQSKELAPSPRQEKE